MKNTGMVKKTKRIVIDEIKSDLYATELPTIIYYKARNTIWDLYNIIARNRMHVTSEFYFDVRKS